MGAMLNQVLCDTTSVVYLPKAWLTTLAYEMHRSKGMIPFFLWDICFCATSFMYTSQSRLDCQDKKKLAFLHAEQL